MKQLLIILCLISVIEVKAQTAATLSNWKVSEDGKSVTAWGDLIYQGEVKKIDTTIDRLAMKSGYTLEGIIGYDSSNVNWFSNNKNVAYWQYNNSGSQFLYKIKADGTIELGDLIIEAVIKGLEKKGYWIIKKPSTYVNSETFLKK